MITGEYPWQPGGVSDYSRLVAKGLVEAGDAVHVWAPKGLVESPDDRGVEVHRLPGNFGPRALADLDCALGRVRPDRILLQYAPHAFGWKAMNLPLCLWLSSSRRQPVWTMFHEVAYPLGWQQWPRHNLLGLVTRAMASMVARASQKIFVSSKAWEPLLQRLSFGRKKKMVWLPVPSNLPSNVCAAASAATKACRSGTLMGHFGTFGKNTISILEPVIVRLLIADINRTMMLAGRGAERFASQLGRRFPQTAERLITNENCSIERLALALANCDILIQPYIDGVSGRRTTAMTGLALHSAIVTNAGASTESLWAESEAVALAPTASPSSLIDAAEALLDDRARRAALGARAFELYKGRFALEHTLRELSA